jgi:hypothetical protein
MAVGTARRRIQVDARIGDDARPGLDDGGAVRTLARAQAVARSLVGQGAAVEIVIADGVHQLDETLVFTPADSGRLGRPVRWMAAPGARPVLSGGRVVGGWTEVGGGVWSAAVGADRFRHLWIGGRRAERVRWPATGTLPVRWDRQRRIIAVDLPAEAPDAAILAGCELVTGNHFTSNRLRIASAERIGGALHLSVRSPESLVWDVQDAFRGGHGWFAGGPGLPLAEGHWQLDDHGILRCRPGAGRRPGDPDCVVVAPRLETVLRFAGDGPQAPVHDLVLSGLAVQHTGWDRPDRHGCVEFQAFRVFSDEQRPGEENSFAPPAAVMLDWAAHVRFTDVAITATGADGLRLGVGTRRCRFDAGVVRDIAGNGIVVGLPAPDHAAWNATWTRQADWSICSDDVIAGSVVEDVGCEHRGAVGIMVGVALGTRILRNRVGRTPYTAISVGWGWSERPGLQGGTRIAGNLVHGAMHDRALHDGGGIYLLGAQPGTVVAGNRITIARGKGAIYFDEGCGPVAAEGNLVESGCALVHSSARTWSNRLRGGWSTTATMTRNPAGSDPDVSDLHTAAWTSWPADVRAALAGPVMDPPWLDRLPGHHGGIDLAAGWMDTIGAWTPGPGPGRMSSAQDGAYGVLRWRGRQCRCQADGAGRIAVVVDDGPLIWHELTGAPLIIDLADLPEGDHEARLRLEPSPDGQGITLGPAWIGAP